MCFWALVSYHCTTCGTGLCRSLLWRSREDHTHTTDYRHTYAHAHTDTHTDIHTQPVCIQSCLNASSSLSLFYKGGDIYLLDNIMYPEVYFCPARQIEFRGFRLGQVIVVEKKINAQTTLQLPFLSPPSRTFLFFFLLHNLSLSR